jgi:hypothetical protein
VAFGIGFALVATKVVPSFLVAPFAHKADGRRRRWDATCIGCEASTVVNFAAGRTTSRMSRSGWVLATDLCQKSVLPNTRG